jgi:hypothetical protein
MVNGFQSVPGPARDPVFFYELRQGQLPAAHADIAEENIIFLSIFLGCQSELVEGNIVNLKTAFYGLKADNI